MRGGGVHAAVLAKAEHHLRKRLQNIHEQSQPPSQMMAIASTLSPSANAEDIHTFVEQTLTARIMTPANACTPAADRKERPSGAGHPAALGTTATPCGSTSWRLVKVICKGRRNTTAVMPGYTHLTALPSLSPSATPDGLCMNLLAQISGLRGRHRPDGRPVSLGSTTL